MSVELLVGRPASGKTEASIQRIREARSAQPLSKIWVLVPDRQKAAEFRKRLADSGGAMGVHIGSFRDLYQDLLEANGTFVPVITPALEHRMVKTVVAEAAAAKELTHFHSIKDKPGFTLAVQDAFAELRGAFVRPERFLEYSSGSTPGRYELAGLYARFLARLHDLNWIDQEGQSWLAISTLQASPEAAKTIQLVVVDGFTSFMGARRQFLKLLSEQVGEVLITLPGKLDSSRPVHRRFLSVYGTLLRELGPEVNEFTASPRLPPVSLHLEKHVLDPGSFPRQAASRPLLLEAPSQADEAREALRWIKELNVREKVPLGFCALFVNNTETYRPLIQSAADEFGMKVHFSRSEPLTASPPVLALLALLSLPTEDYRARDLLSTLRSPFFDFGLDGKALEDLEKVSQQACIVAGRDQWEDAWEMLEKARSAANEELDEERRRDDLTTGTDLQVLRAAFSRFWLLFDGIAQSRSQANWVTWLEELLERMHFFEGLSSRRDAQVADSISDALKALVMSESVAGTRMQSYTEFLSDLLGTLNGARTIETTEARRNALLVGEMVEARGSRFKAVALLGLSEGLFPAVETPDPFLDEQLRSDLGLEPRLQREQASIFYQAVTRTDAHLLMTRPHLSESGDAWEASPYWLAAQELFSTECVQKAGSNTTLFQANAASSQELLFWGVQQNHLLFQDDQELNPRWQFVHAGGEVLRARRSKWARGEYEGNTGQVADALARQYSSLHTWSASRLEEYGTCPHKFYINSVLGLVAKSPPELGLNAAQLGTILHRILERAYRASGSSGDIASLIDNLGVAAGDVFSGAPAELGFRPSPLWDIEQEQLVQLLQESVQALQDESAGWRPERFEQRFGRDNEPELVIDLGSEAVHLHGVIDRVDSNLEGQLRVLDYKTGSANLETSDLRSGRRLQLPIYAMAAQEALKLGEVVDGFYWKIKQAQASSFRLSLLEIGDVQGPEAAYVLVKEHLRRSIAGIRSGEFQPHPPKGGCPDYCPAAQWCWRYQASY